MERSFGTIRTWNHERKFGFIKCAISGNNVFLHLSDVQLEHRPNIAVGQTVEFTLVNAPKGIAARDAVVIG